MNVKLGIVENEFDILIDSGGIATGDGLVTAVMLSLFSWRRARPDDDIPEDSPRYGWWGDMLTGSGQKTGSRLWLLQRRKLTNKTISDAVGYITECLQWLMDDGVASKIEVVPERNGIDRLDILIKIYRNMPNGSVELRFGSLWDAMINKSTEPTAMRSAEPEVKPSQMANVYSMEDFYNAILY